MDLPEDKIRRCERAIAYTVGNDLCAEALNAAGDYFYASGQTISRLRKNDRLAVYGDIAAAERLCRRWYDSGLDKGRVAILSG